HVVAASVEGQMRGTQCQRRLELLLDDGADELSAHGEVGVVDRGAEGIGPSLRREIRPPARRAIGQLIADALREGVTDGDESHGRRGFLLGGLAADGSVQWAASFQSAPLPSCTSSGTESSAAEPI